MTDDELKFFIRAVDILRIVEGCARADVSNYKLLIQLAEGGYLDLDHAIEFLEDRYDSIGGVSWVNLLYGFDIRISNQS